MSRYILPAAALLAALALPGCQGMGATRAPRGVALNEPGLDPIPGAPAAVVEATPPRDVTWVDRHPLFSRPRDYYEGTGTNKVTKTAAATLIGIPAGLYGEVRQIVVGRPPAAPY